MSTLSIQVSFTTLAETPKVLSPIMFGTICGDGTLIKIDYPGMGNFSQFSYDGEGRSAKIIETVAGSITSTKQFVWCSDRNRLYRACEERDGSGALTKRFFDRGQRDSSINFFYTKDHLGSIREMADSSANIVCQQSFDPWGVAIRLVSTTSADFGYSEMYQHGRSALNLTLLRAYNPNLSRWLSRDPLGELAGLNLYAYVANNPILLIDPYGAQKCDPCEGKTGWALFECRRANDPCKNIEVDPEIWATS